MIPLISTVQNKQIHGDTKQVSVGQELGVQRKWGVTSNEHRVLFEGGGQGLETRERWWLYNTENVLSSTELFP